MKKYALMITLASVIAAPSYAQTAGETNVMKTETAVERAAREQGFSSGSAAAPAPGVIENSSVMMMAPESPATAAEPAQTTMPVLSGTPANNYGGPRPGLIKNELPAGLVMNGPGTEAYKKKHRKKKKKAAVEQVAPVAERPKKEEPQPEPVKEATPEPTPELPPVAEEPPAMPDVTATPPVESAPEPQADPFAQPAPDGAAPDLGMPAPDAPAPSPAPGTPGSLQPPDDPFGTPPGQ